MMRIPAKQRVVELHIYKDGTTKLQRSLQYRKKATAMRREIPLGTAAVFDYKINWQELGGTVCKVEAFLVSEIKNTSYRRHGIQTVIRSLKENGELRRGNRPGNSEKEEIPAEQTFEGYKGESLRIFKTTGYCGSAKCSGWRRSHLFRYRAAAKSHTISADITVLPPEQR